VRLCDRAPCAERWPCSRHGTLTVGDYEHLGRHAGAFELFACMGVADVTSCGVCGYGLCSCSPAVPVASAEPTTGATFGAWHRSANHAMRWLYGFRPGLRVVVEQHDSGAWTWGCKVPGGGVSWREYANSKEEAMRAAEVWGRTQPGAPALRPGWTTDGEGYFNDAIALMVVRAESHQAWQVLANGEPWLQGQSFCSFATLEGAMEWAERLGAPYRCRKSRA